jgi:hypothetical protein
MNQVTYSRLLTRKELVRLGIARLCEKKLSLIGGISLHDGTVEFLGVTASTYNSKQ